MNKSINVAVTRQCVALPNGATRRCIARSKLGRLAASAAVVFLVTLTGGCGDGNPQRVPISGQVLIDGAPVTHGYVRFISTQGRPSMGNLDAEGRFVLSCFDKDDGAILGQHQVEVNGEESLSANKVRWHAPKKYADYRTSGLTQEVRDAADDVRIELTWDGGKPFVENFGSGSDEESGYHRGGKNAAR